MLISELFEGAINDRFITTANGVDFFLAISDVNAMDKNNPHARIRASERSVTWLLDKSDPRFVEWYSKAAAVLKAKATPDPVERPYLVTVTSLNQSAILWYQTRGEIARITTFLPQGHNTPKSGTTKLEI